MIPYFLHFHQDILRDIHTVLSCCNKEYQLGNRSNSKLKKINTISKLVEKSGSRRSTGFLLLLAALVSTINNVLEIGLSKDYTRMLHKLLEKAFRAFNFNIVVGG
jgi:hypothetical protein